MRANSGQGIVDIRTLGEQGQYVYNSCDIFFPESKFRKACVWLVEWQHWETMILLLVLSSIALLALFDYNDRDFKNFYNNVLHYLNIVITTLFGLEAFVNIVAMGFVSHKHSYLRNYWHIIDIFIILFGVLDAIPPLCYQRELRIFLVLRPFKLTYISSAMNQLMIPWLHSLKRVADVFAFILFVLVIFSILGCHEFQGAVFMRCRKTKEPIDDVWPIDRDVPRFCNAYGSGDFNCPADTWCGTPDMHGLTLEYENITSMEESFFGVIGFDNLWKSFLACFQVINLEDWGRIMYTVQDSSDAILSKIFFPALIFLGSFLCFNLILGVIVESFQQYRDQINEKAEESKRLMLQSEVKAKALQQNDVESQGPLTKRSTINNNPPGTEVVPKEGDKKEEIDKRDEEEKKDEEETPKEKKPSIRANFHTKP